LITLCIGSLMGTEDVKVEREESEEGKLLLEVNLN
jgi:hypothetical protein